MRVETTVDSEGITHKHYIFEPGEVAVKTGPITGLMTLGDGKKVNVSEEYVLVADQAQADELADLIGRQYAEQGHPDDVEEDPETGELVQRDFVYVTPDEQSALVADPSKSKES